MDCRPADAFNTSCVRACMCVSAYACVFVLWYRHGYVLRHQDSVCSWPACRLAVPELSEPFLGQLSPHTPMTALCSPSQLCALTLCVTMFVYVGPWLAPRRELEIRFFIFKLSEEDIWRERNTQKLASIWSCLENNTTFTPDINMSLDADPRSIYCSLLYSLYPDCVWNLLWSDIQISQAGLAILLTNMLHLRSREAAELLRAVAYLALLQLPFNSLGAFLRMCSCCIFCLYTCLRSNLSASLSICFLRAMLLCAFTCFKLLRYVGTDCVLIHILISIYCYT